MMRPNYLAKLGLSLWMALFACAPAHAGIFDNVYRWVSGTPSQPAAAKPPAEPSVGQQGSGQQAGEGQGQRVQPSPESQPRQAAPVTAPAASPTAAPTAAPRAETAPRSEASLNPSLVYGDRMLTEDLVWRGEVLVEGALTVAPQATLTIEPGTVIHFRRKGGQAPLLVVQGRVVATGTKEAPVIFTSGFATAAAGDWQGMMLLGTEKKNLLENCRIEGAQTALEVLFSNVTLKNVLAERSQVGMRFQDALLFMDGGGAHGCDTGLSLVESESTLRNISVVGNRQGVVAKRSSIYLFEGNLSGNQTALSADGSRLKIQGGALLSNGSGVSLMACEGTVAGAKLANNREYGISLTGSRMRVNGNRITGNGQNGLVVFDGASVVWDNAIYENAGYDLYNAGVEEFRAPGNWWGSSAPKIFDNNGRGKVLYSPVLGQWPQKQ
ncbi:right-handed parallel beta-helix repeat-containing protein [Geomonas sp.]|uniref:right-handed parallel beta-helix repeat-containing protein n=1 Tax=Geomonas sp. TaxID=2651584 RepID=UPI002B493234|nr:right-handed parallel beta-helix repeat-containing protein [Geomonas sp.]HJV33585.1 right-handed parallel beta-helix repeat-containing protein [Geomonas sp.]